MGLDDVPLRRLERGMIPFGFEPGLLVLGDIGVLMFAFLNGRLSIPGNVPPIGSDVWCGIINWIQSQLTIDESLEGEVFFSNVRMGGG